MNKQVDFTQAFDFASKVAEMNVSVLNETIAKQTAFFSEFMADALAQNKALQAAKPEAVLGVVSNYVVATSEKTRKFGNESFEFLKNAQKDAVDLLVKQQAAPAKAN